MTREFSRDDILGWTIYYSVRVLTFISITLIVILLILLAGVFLL